MIRRTFLILISTLGFGSITISFIESSFLRRIIYKIHDLLTPSFKLPPDCERLVAKLPPLGEDISVEMAINSRCTSDYDENSKKFHWGIFDRKRKLSNKQIGKIINLVKVPRFTNLRLEIQSDCNILTFLVDNHVSGILKEWIMVESGMQQQAVGLVCAALGVGIIFKNIGKDGATLSNSDFGTMQIKIDAMQPSYNGSFWSSSPPATNKSLSKGNLPDPVRVGNMPLISALDRLKIENRNGSKSTDESISQLLWAARGRTPHFYKSRPWGMTIPTWAGEQHISSVYLISNNRLSSYINWNKRGPNHSLLTVNKIDRPLIDRLSKSFSLNQRFIILAKNETFSRALWEVGYQLLNLLLQAHSLNILYQAALLDENQKNLVRHMGVRDPVALFAI